MKVLDSVFPQDTLFQKRWGEKVILYFSKKVQWDVWKKDWKILKRGILFDYEDLSHFILVSLDFID